MQLELNDVVAGYLPGVEVLRRISMGVDPGEIVCLIGPNGAGKSTVLRVISGLLVPTAGAVRFEGQALNGMRPDLILRRGIAHVPQGHSSFPEMTVQENLLMGAYILNDRKELHRRMERVYRMFPVLEERKTVKAGNFSGGEQKMLEIGRALMMLPEILMLDEPSLGLAPKMARLVFETIERLREETGIAVLLVEQNARSGLGIADRAYVLELGEAKIDGSAASILEDSRIAQLYLGGTVTESVNSKGGQHSAGAAS